MVTRTLSISLVAMSLAASAAVAATLTERMQTERMTVLEVDRAAGRFKCAEHRRWMPVVKKNLQDVHPGDIVRVEPTAGQPSRLVVLRAAADELSSPE
jgi:translation initiation factor IF-1